MNSTKIFIQFLERSQIDISLLLLQYENETFPNSDIIKSEVFYELINNKVSVKTQSYIDSILGSQSLSHNRDTRTPVEYARDIALGWLCEDAISIQFKDAGLPLKTHGADKNRVFLKGASVSSSADFTFGFNKFIRNLELVTDLKTHWKTHNKCDIRDDKFKKLMSQKTILFGICYSNSTAFVLDTEEFPKELEVSLITAENHVWGKPVTQIKGVSHLLQPLEQAIEQVVNTFIETVISGLDKRQ